MINKKLFRNNKIAILISVLVLLVTLMPLYVIAHFNYPTTDDFCFAEPIYWGLRQNESWWTIIRNAWKLVWHYYMTWQGRYFDVSMYCFGVGTAVPELYFIGTYLVITSFVFATVCFLRILTYRVMKWDSDISWIVAIWFTIIQIWYVPHAVEAFYWYAGATAYTLPYALTLLLFTSLICYYDSKKSGRKVIYMSLNILFAVLVGGSNYAIALLAAEIYAITIIVCMRKRKKYMFLIVSFVVYMCCFACNALSPGNKSRLSIVDSLGVVGSIVASLKKAAGFCVEWFHIPIFIFCMFVLILCYKQIVQMNYQFKLPVLVTAISFGLFASMLTPPFFAGATWGPGRLINMVYYCYYFLLCGNILYWIGWITHRWKGIDWKGLIPTDISVVVMIVSVLFLVCFKGYGLQSNNSTSALLSLMKGEAKQYKLENQERWKLYEDETYSDVEVNDFSVKPYVLYYDDIQTDDSDWRNYAVAHFFGKNSVKIKE